MVRQVILDEEGVEHITDDDRGGISPTLGTVDVDISHRDDNEELMLMEIYFRFPAGGRDLRERSTYLFEAAQRMMVEIGHYADRGSQDQ